jgi:arylformamidase
MVAQIRRAIAWIYRNASRLGGDPARIHVSGHSSGGHLAACVAVTDWPAEFDLPGDIVKSVICASGIYDLRPVRLSARNLYLKLDEEVEQALSPIRHLDRMAVPVYVAVGALESDEFKRQAASFAAALGTALVSPLTEYAGLNHFEIVETLADPAGGLGAVALALMGVTVKHPAA